MRLETLNILASVSKTLMFRACQGSVSSLGMEGRALTTAPHPQILGLEALALLLLFLLLYSPLDPCCNA